VIAAHRWAERGEERGQAVLIGALASPYQPAGVMVTTSRYLWSLR
jgi:hypothetical protein